MSGTDVPIAYGILVALLVVVVSIAMWHWKRGQR
jgi:tetrahydromethanopterin S-methyltransferase subunit G